MGEILFAIGEMILQHTLFILAGWAYGTPAAPRPAWIKHTIRILSVAALLYLSALVLNAYVPELAIVSAIAALPDLVFGLILSFAIVLFVVLWVGEVEFNNMGWFYGSVAATLTIAIAAIVANFV